MGDEAYLDLAGSCSGLSPVCARLHLSSGQVQKDDHPRSWRVCRLLHPGCRLLRQERQVCRQVQESKESQVRVELLVLCVHLDCEELQLQQGQRLLEDRKREVLRRQLPGRDGCGPYPQCAQGSQQTGTARLVGWRINPVAGYLNEELGEKQVSLVQDCGQSGRICSTSATTDCGGDYGGPLIQGSNTLIGAAVSDSGCDDAGGKGLFSQISEHTEWVKTTIAAHGGGDVCTSR